MTKIITANMFVYVGEAEETAQLIGQAPSIAHAKIAMLDYAESFLGRCPSYLITDANDRRRAAGDLFAKLCGFESVDMIPNVFWRIVPLTNSGMKVIFLKTMLDPFQRLGNIIELSYQAMTQVGVASEVVAEEVEDSDLYEEQATERLRGGPEMEKQK